MTAPFQPNDLLFNKYRIEGPIGEGAFAQVYRARHVSLNALRALKVLRREAPEARGVLGPLRLELGL